MKINNIAEEFLNNYEATASYYENHFKKYPEIYDYYFQNHCNHKEQKLAVALTTHPNKLNEMHWIAQQIPQFSREITENYSQRYSIQFSKPIHIFVGLGGSNAYTYRSMNPEIAFCVEKLEAYPTSLQTIIAHEFGHALHHIVTEQHNIDANVIPWNSPITWLFQEGIATYLSMQIVHANYDVYFAYKKDPEWLTFCKTNEKNIINKLQHDLQQLTTAEIFKEWFSINGGIHFGYTRLGYYIGFLIVEKLIQNHNELTVLTLWQYDDFIDRIKQVLAQLVS